MLLFRVYYGLEVGQQIIIHALLRLSCNRGGKTSSIVDWRIETPACFLEMALRRDSRIGKMRTTFKGLYGL
jgi:hypothetical protein